MYVSPKEPRPNIPKRRVYKSTRCHCGAKHFPFCPMDVVLKSAEAFPGTKKGLLDFLRWQGERISELEASLRYSDRRDAGRLKGLRAHGETIETLKRQIEDMRKSRRARRSRDRRFDAYRPDDEPDWRDNEEWEIESEQEEKEAEEARGSGAL